MGKVMVVVRSDDPLLVAGVTAMVDGAPGLEAVQGTADEAAASVAVVVCEQVEARTTGLVEELHAAGLRVVLVCSDLDEGGLLGAVAAGASALLRRAEVTAERLVAAVEGAGHGDGALPPDLLGVLLDSLRATERDVLRPRGLSMCSLSAREVDVLRLLAEGFDTADVARKLAYSERTIKGVVQEVMRRHGLRNRTHAVAYGMRLGLL